MRKYLEGEEISENEIRDALRKGTLAMKIVPVVTGSAFKNKGVQTLLDAVVDYLPSPLDVPAIEGINPKTDEMVDASGRSQSSFLGPGVQANGGQAPRAACFRAHLFRHGQIRFLRLQTRSRKTRNASGA